MLLLALALMDLPQASQPLPDPAPAATAPAAPPAPFAVRDPWEKTNRAIDRFNTGLDKVTFKPLSKAYVAVVPDYPRTRIARMVDNLNEPITALNDVLQLHPRALGRTALRMVINTTIGLGGMFDVAADAGLPRHIADFGQSLGRWGVRPGPYLVLPFFGPANLRDGLGRLVDNVGDPVALTFAPLTSTQGAVRASLMLIDERTRLDSTLQAISEASDPYAFARSGYMQNRAATVREARGEAEVLPDYDMPPAASPLPAAPPTAAAPAPTIIAQPVEPPK